VLEHVLPPVVKCCKGVSTDLLVQWLSAIFDCLTCPLVSPTHNNEQHPAMYNKMLHLRKRSLPMKTEF